MTKHRPSLLMVTTVAATMHFLVPYANHFRAQGWRVDGAARDLTTSSRASAFDTVYDVPFSRSIKSLRSHVTSSGEIASVLERGYDIVHVHTPIASFITRAVARRMPADRRPAMVYTAHGFHFYRGGHPLANAVFVTAERIGGRMTDRLVVINEEDFEAARRYRLVGGRRLRYMPGIGVDTDWYDRENVTAGSARAALEDIGVDPDRPRFVSIGELSRRKRSPDLVRALAAMEDREATLLYLGDGPERSTIERLAAELGVTDRVVISPTWVSDVRPFLRDAVALVHASRQEGLPRSIMEALALKVPVITTAARGCPELVGDDRGHVVPVGATHRMAAAMDHLLDAPAERAAMGERGRRLMVERYDLRILIGEHERLYDELLPAATASEPGRDA